MTSIRAIVLLIAMRAACVPGVDMTVLKTHLQELYRSDAPREAMVGSWVKAQKPDGSWPDIDYTDQNRSDWLTVAHVKRLRDMSAVYRTPDSSLAGDTGLREAVTRGMELWLDHDYTNPNWWWNQIGVPKEVASICLLMDSDFSDDLRERAVNTVLVRAKPGMTGQNKIWIAGITLARAVLTGDAALAAQSRDAIVGEIRITPHEGVQPDFSFHQHGAQQQFGNYGLAFIHDAVCWGTVFDGTSFALDARQTGVVRDYLVEGLAWVMWRDLLDISACGRQLGPNSPRYKGNDVLHAIREIPKFDPAHAQMYARVAAQIGTNASPEDELVGYRHFWRSDMSVFRRPGFYASVKMSSKRVLGTETCNGENMQGLYLGDGVTLLYRSGAEYDNIFPVWNWRRLPGLTAPRNSCPLVPDQQSQNHLAFVGGAGDGRNGVTAMEYQRAGLTARKAWFFSGDGVVCLGAAIEYDGDDPVVTCVNQCLLSGAVTVGRGNGSYETLSGRHELDSPVWIQHGGFGYAFLVPQKVYLKTDSRMGDWKSVDLKYDAKPVHKDVFELTVDHGKNPSGATYAWWAVPVDAPADMKARIAGQCPQLLSNTSQLQAVRFPFEDEIQAVFYEAGALVADGGLYVSTDTPCLLTLRTDENGALNVIVAEPSQEASALNLTLSGHYTGASSKWDNASGMTTIHITLPSGEQAGSSLKLALTVVR